jgi:hypothetical protein
VIEFAFEGAALRRPGLSVVHAWQTPSAFTLGPGDIAVADDPHRAEGWQGFMSAVHQVWCDE